MAIGTGVKTKHADYENYSKKWKRCRDVVSGQDAVQGAGPAYLAPLKDQDPLEYAAYVNRTPFYNATWRTIAGFIGMLYRKPPTLEVPKALEEMLEDVTLSGISFLNFAQDCTLEDLEVSRLGVLVDHPTQQTDENGLPIKFTLAQTAKLGLRPSMQQYKAESIINWKYGRVDNKTVLTQVRLLETAEIDVSEFEIEIEKRIRVLDLFENKYRIRLFKEETEEQIGGDVYPLMNSAFMNFIPFYFIGPDGNEGNLDDPILIDLVDLNLKHYSVSADYEHGCHFTGLPTPVISGYQTQTYMDDPEKPAPAAEKFYIGSTTAWVFPDPQAKASFLEFSGQGLDALEKNLARKEAQMAAIGARMLAPEKSGVEASDTLAMRHNGENSILSAIAVAVSQGLLKALKTFCDWAGYPSANIKFEINREFIPIIADSALLTQLMALVQGGHMDEESLFNWLKRADLLDPDLTYEDMQGKIDSQPPVQLGLLNKELLTQDNPDDKGVPPKEDVNNG